MNENTKSIQIRVKEFLGKKTRKDYFAECIDVTPSILSNWFAGRYRFDDEKIELIENILNGKIEI